MFESKITCPSRKLHFLSDVSSEPQKSLQCGIISCFFSIMTLFNLTAPGLSALRHKSRISAALYLGFLSALSQCCVFLVNSNQQKSLFFAVRSFLCDCCWMWSVLDNWRRPLKQSRPEPQQRLALTGKKKIKELLKLVHVTWSSLYIKPSEAGMPLSSSEKMTFVFIFKVIVHYH